MNPRELADFTRRAALALGFDACGITDLAPNAAAPALTGWLDRGYHGDMTYVARQSGIRREPALAWPAARSIVVVLHNYYTESGSYPGECRVARYAQGEDYHKVTRDRLRELAGRVGNEAGRGSFKFYVDAGPLPERELARRAGLGWVGKNTMLIRPSIGSFTFIGCLLTDLELAPDMPFDEDRCGTCRACLDACPTGAFPEPRVLDARRCISYLTIESRTDISADLRPLVGDNLFGCDICQDVCPWNVKFAQPTREPRFAAPAPDARPPLEELRSIADETFDAVFGRSAMKRAGARGLRRNALVVLENQAVSRT